MSLLERDDSLTAFVRKKSTAKHIETIWPQLAQRLQDEYAFAGYTLDSAKASFLDEIAKGVGHTLFSEDGSVLAVMVWQDDTRGVATSFAATEAFFSREYVQPFRDYMDEFQKLRHNAGIVSHSFSNHPRIVAWFNSLKFELEREEGVYRVFYRAPRASIT